MVIDATKERKGREEALALAKTAERVVVAKGKKVLAFDMKDSPPDDDALAAAILGPTGNLRRRHCCGERRCWSALARRPTRRCWEDDSRLTTSLK